MIRFSDPPSVAPRRKTGPSSSCDFSLENKSRNIFSVPLARSSPKAGEAHQGQKIRYDARMNFSIPQCFLAEGGTGKNPFIFSLRRAIG